MEWRACATPHPNVSALKDSIKEDWDEMSEEYIKKTCDSFRPRLEAKLAANGDHFES